MLRAQPLAFLRVTAPWAVVRLSWSKEVQVELFRLVQLPLEDQVIPAERNMDSACAWVSLVTAEAWVAVSRRADSAATRATRILRRGFGMSPVKRSATSMTSICTLRENPAGHA